MTMSAPRFAVYWAPAPGSDLAAFGNRWLGRDAETGQSPASLVGDLPPSWEAATADARIYGFHATLKPPFRTRAGIRREEVASALRGLAARLSPVTGIQLRLETIDGFLALTPRDERADLAELAQRCVEDLDWLRAPADAAELARRRATGLTPRQEALLLRWGYPYVMEEFRFHLTLTRRLEPASRETFAAILKPHADAVCGVAHDIDALCLFEQPSPGAAFNVRLRVPLGGQPRMPAISRRSG
jgi:putative phosphonate metabolism protein